MAIETDVLTKHETQIRPISADSHVTEPPDCYTRFIDPKYRDSAPKVIPDERRGFVY
jgi:hypothetical protein